MGTQRVEDVKDTPLAMVDQAAGWPSTVVPLPHRRRHIARASHAPPVCGHPRLCKEIITVLR